MYNKECRSAVLRHSLCTRPILDLTTGCILTPLKSTYYSGDLQFTSDPVPDSFTFMFDLFIGKYVKWFISFYHNCDNNNLVRYFQHAYL